MSEDIDALASLIHEEQCVDHPRCGRWDSAASRHRQYYRDRAQHLIERLEPVIGIANVFIVIPVVLDELL